MRKLIYNPDQQYCGTCGQHMVPDQPLDGRELDGIWTLFKNGDFIAITCPNPACNHGSWAEIRITDDDK